MTIFQNYPLIASICSILFAQFVKFPIALFSKKDGAHVSLVTSTGGMPSSHSSFVIGLANSVGLTEGYDSTIFALSLVFALVVMYDAAGVRQSVGQQAVILNQLFDMSDKQSKVWRDYDKLKELVGHTPIEVFFGALLGIILSTVLI